MAKDPRISELLLRWREARQQGRPVSAEEVCAGSPELLEEVRRAIKALEAMERWLGIGDEEFSGSGSLTMPHIAGPPLPLPAFAIPGHDILGVIDQGGMGIVYRARQSRLKRLVALKMIRTDLHVKPHQLARFKVEAEAVARLQHPNIVQVFEVGDSEGRPYFSMELVEGGSLAGKTAGQPVDPLQAAELIATLADTIHFAHERGIIHRDLKPANVLLTHGLEPEGFGEPKIADFGLAKLLNSDSSPSALGHATQSGAILGTPCYMAPEQAEGKPKSVGPPTDVYALGAILYELLTGKPPFRGESSLDTLLRVVSSPPVPPSRVQPKVPRDLETICLKCLEKAPDQRYPTAQALAQDLRRFLNGEPIKARSTSWARRALKWARRRPEAAALVAVLVLAVFGLGAFLVVRHHQQQQAQESATRLAPRAREILYRYCYDCHGRDPKAQGNLHILDYDLLVDPTRQLVVPGDVKESKLIHRTIDDNSMPPVEEEEFARLSLDEQEDLRKWVAGGAPPFPPEWSPPPPEQPTPLSIEVKDIFLNKCRECHRFDNAKKGITILNHDLLVTKRKVVVRGKPEQSLLFQLLRSKDRKRVMPPPDEMQLTPEEIDTIRRWIAEGAAPFPRTVAGKP